MPPPLENFMPLCVFFTINAVSLVCNICFIFPIDTTAERNYLHKKAFPELTDWCREKHVDFQVVDMRWGVRDEATAEHMTTELCIREIQNCQQLSIGPNFMVSI